MSLGALGSVLTRGNVNAAIANPLVPGAGQGGQTGINNALSTAQSVLQLQGSLASRAAGQAYQGAIDQSTGEFDPNKFRTLLAQDPRAAMAAGPALENVQNISSNQLEQARAKLDYWNGASANLVENPSHGNAMQLLGQGLDSGMLTLPEAQRLANQVLTVPPGQLADYGRQHMIQAGDARTRFDQIYGTRQAVNYGGGTVITTTPPPGRGGDVNIPQTFTPEFLGGTVTVPDPNRTLPNGQPNPNYGRDIQITRGDLLGRLGIPIPQGPPQVTRTGSTTDLGNGRYPPAALRNPNAQPPGGNAATPPPASPPPTNAATPPLPTPPVPPAPVRGTGFGTSAFGTAGGPVPNAPAAPATPPARAAAPPPTSPLPTPPPPTPAAPTPPPAAPAPVVGGLSAGEKAGIQSSGDRFQAEADNDTKAQSQLAVLENMRNDAAQFATGPGAEGTKSFKQIMTTWPGLSSLASAFGLKPESVAANESFDKLVNQIVQSQGANSDQRMAVDIAATPHSGLTPQGIDLIVKQLEGNSDYLRARAKLASQFPNRSDYGGFQSAISQLDPRVYQYNRMSDDQKHTYFNAMDTNTRDAFKKAYRWAQQPTLPWAGNANLIPGGGNSA